MNKENKEEECPSCIMNAGVGIAFKICDLAEIDCEDVKEQVFNQKITLQEAIDTIKDRLKQKNDDFSVELVEEVENILNENLNPSDNPEDKQCVSIFVKNKMSQQIDEWVGDREEALKNADPNSKFIEGTKELIDNLKKSKKSIENLETCEIKKGS